MYNYRSVRDDLFEDFENRCAYSMLHGEQAGFSTFEIDHFNPKKRRSSSYQNLFPCWAPINRKKGDAWELKQDKRFLNPCREQDYGDHIVEVFETGELIALTKVGHYHINKLGLNNLDLVKWRRVRQLAWAAKNELDNDTSLRLSIPSNFSHEDILNKLGVMSSYVIPYIPLVSPWYPNQSKLSG